MAIWNKMKTKEEEKMLRSYWLDEDTVETFLDEDCVLKPNSKVSYRNQIFRFGRVLKHNEITTATKKDLEDFLNAYAVTNGEGAAYSAQSVLTKYSRWLFVTHRVPEDIGLDLALNYTYGEMVRKRKMKKDGVVDTEYYTLEEIAELLLTLESYPKEEVLSIVKGARNGSEN